MTTISNNVTLDNVLSYKDISAILCIVSCICTNELFEYFLLTMLTKMIHGEKKTGKS